MINYDFICENHNNLRHQRSIVFYISIHYGQTLNNQEVV